MRAGKIFCESCSIRGVQKITKARSKFLRFVWIVFLVVMTNVLLIGSTFLIIDYLDYDTAWHTSTKIDSPLVFPSITICSHNAFALKAETYWSDSKSNNILTPKKFSKYLRESTLYNLRNNRTDRANLVLYDNVQSYYMNIKYNESILLGHEKSMLSYCILIIQGITYVAENCSFTSDVGFKVTLFSHPEYFNCYTITSSETSNLVESLMIIIALVPFGTLSKKHLPQATFLMDVLSRGEGVKLVIHERGTYPDVQKNGINVEPGKMNEITYENIEWNKISTRRVQCVTNPESIVDLNQQFAYTLPQCLDAKLQNASISKCRCIMSIWPRLIPPTFAVPYCADFNQTSNNTLLNARFVCAGSVLGRTAEIKKEAEGTSCLPRCYYTTYDLSKSITEWNPDALRLAQLSQLTSASNKYSDDEEDASLKQRYIEAIEINGTATSDRMSKIFANSHSYTYVNLKRKNGDTIKKTEHLVLEVSVLISRIGGLCSLCIGLTAAFFVELIEVIYIFYFRKDTVNAVPTKEYNVPMSDQTRFSQHEDISDDFLPRLQQLQRTRTNNNLIHDDQFVWSKNGGKR